MNRLDNLREIIRYGVEANIQIPTQILEEKFKGKRERFFNSLNELQSDTGLTVVMEEIPDSDLTNIQIKTKEKEDVKK